MDDDQYDEFGNPLHGDAYESSGDETGETGAQLVRRESADEHGEAARDLVLQRAEESVYGPDVELLVELEDREGLGVPLVKAESERRRVETAVFTQRDRNVPRARYDREYMMQLACAPERCRAACVVGALHSGKTSLLDLLAVQAHERLPYMSKAMRQGWKPLKYTDSLKIEIERGVSMKLNGFTFLGADGRGQSHVLTLIDTPGHVNFMDETAVAMRACDVCIVVVDVVEGLSSVVESLIKRAERLGLPLIFVLNKIDRLLLELKLPVKDCSLKLHALVDKINAYTQGRYSPERGNVLFASSKLGFTFTLEEFVKYYYAPKLQAGSSELVERLWGRVYFHKGQFSLHPNPENEVTFVQFVLKPLYKIITHTLSKDPSDIERLLHQELGISLGDIPPDVDQVPLLKMVMGRVFGDETGLIDAIVKHGQPSTYKSQKELPVNADGTVAHVLKLMEYGGELWSLVRIYSGELRAKDFVSVINESQDVSAIEEDEITKVQVGQVALLGGRYILPVTHASAGQLVLVKGLDEYYTKSATIFTGPAVCFPLIDYYNEPVFKVVVQPQVPSELPKLLDGLNLVHKLYPGAVIKVEETGEQVIFGSGELYLDTLLYDLRQNCAKIEIKVSMPLVKFSEGCSDTSFAAIPVSSPDGKIKLVISAEPLQQELIRDLTRGKLVSSELQDMKTLARKLRNDYGWDSLAARSVRSFHNCNVFLDDTLPDEVDKGLVNAVMRHILQGFKWALREGPLAEEPIYGVQFKLLDLQIEGDHSSSSIQLVALVRRACYIALLTAVPVILEPIYEVDIVVHEVLASIVKNLFAKRRSARIYKIEAIVGTPLIEVKGQMPVIESVGFETDLRLATSGGAMCQMHFWNKIWHKVPGDVMDEEAVIPKLKPAPMDSLSRDFVMKTRRRKGLSSEGYQSNNGPTLEKYIEPELYAKLRERGLV
ncbi:AEL124Wp [Eremothecium gossypii ATCC 10895]|uniref:AEL124Wp n=1 Tax=Eremothecium gossypii (strain ATCC 10895 / CBS 109.51 / FGSC 9923 / NRRL Y-1056) TaxID=284811 RepID=Q757Y4_EREGS|nr:AEL124Wp [Eremothecium gossypii ATCC 10895]AAS52561.1 AEL124Wp [Eremothecium gossypii ATCC 10895]AEY96862.1 FAEL124Wp [Eremothecium gossypii FDAG1]